MSAVELERTASLFEMRDRSNSSNLSQLQSLTMSKLGGSVDQGLDALDNFRGNGGRGEGREQQRLHLEFLPTTMPDPCMPIQDQHEDQHQIDSTAALTPDRASAASYMLPDSPLPPPHPKSRSPPLSQQLHCQGSYQLPTVQQASGFGNVSRSKGAMLKSPGAVGTVQLRYTSLIRRLEGKEQTHAMM